MEGDLHRVRSSQEVEEATPLADGDCLVANVGIGSFGAQQMRLLIYESYDLVMHGNQKYVSMLLGSLPRKGVDVQMRVPHKGPLFDMNQSGGRVAVSGIKDLHREIIRTRPHAILCNNERSLLSVAPAALAAGVPLFWFVKHSRSFPVIDQLCSFLALRVLALSEECVVNKRGLDRRKLKLLPLGHPLRDLTKIKPAEDLPGPLKVLCLAQVTHAKGIDTAIEAVRILEDRGVVMVLRVAGATPHGQESFARKMERIAAKLRRSRVEWLGWRSNVEQLLEWADIFALPSRSEGVPRSIVEAMAAARPVVASNVGGCESIVKHGVTGFIVRPDDPVALAASIESLARDAKLRARMAMAGRRFVCKHHDFDVHVDRLVGYLREGVGHG